MLLICCKWTFKTLPFLWTYTSLVSAPQCALPLKQDTKLKGSLLNNHVMFDKKFRHNLPQCQLNIYSKLHYPITSEKEVAHILKLEKGYSTYIMQLREDRCCLEKVLSWEIKTFLGYHCKLSTFFTFKAASLQSPVLTTTSVLICLIRFLLAMNRSDANWKIPHYTRPSDDTGFHERGNWLFMTAPVFRWCYVSQRIET